MTIRDAEDADLPHILEIYNDAIARTTAVYIDEPVTLAERRDWFHSRRERGFPVLVAAESGHVVGFASFGMFNPRPGYRFTVEHSVFVAPDTHGRGVGTALMRELIARAEALGTHAMIGVVDAENAASIRFHEKLGFTRAGRLEEVGWKFGRWLDAVYMQLVL